MARTLLTRSSIEAALGEGGAAAIRSVTEYQPAGGQGDKVFPPTYEGATYATEERILDGAIVPCVLLDAVASQANRMEVALLGDWRAGNISLPVITVDFRGHDLANPFTVTSLEAPHRIADALLRDSLLDGVSFREIRRQAPRCRRSGQRHSPLRTVSNRARVWALGLDRATRRPRGQVPARAGF